MIALTLAYDKEGPEEGTTQGGKSMKEPGYN